jgi:sugar phosphate isomerase/epimerase
MPSTRRQLLAGIVGGVVRAGAQVRTGRGPKIRTTPAVCLYSQAVIKVPYDELGPILQGLGVDGCDLTVQQGGHVGLDNIGLHLMRAIEAITGVGLDVPVLSTAFTSLSNPVVQTVAAIAAEMGIPLLRTGTWDYNTASEPEARLLEVQRDLSGLAALARAAKLAFAVQNVAGEHIGAALWDLNLVMRGMDPAGIGWDYDIGYATEVGGGGAWWNTLRLARPRLKMVSVRDFVWTKDASGAWKATPCALGEGMVDFARFFGALAQARFLGPISVGLDYSPKDEVGAIRRDVEFIKKQVSSAYGSK